MVEIINRRPNGMLTALVEVSGYIFTAEGWTTSKAPLYRAWVAYGNGNLDDIYAEAMSLARSAETPHSAKIVQYGRYWPARAR